MRAGILTEQIEIQYPQTVRTETGSESIVYSTKYTIRSRVKVNQGNLVNENGDIFFTKNVEFEIRHFYKDVTEVMRIKWKDNYYRILSILQDKQNINIYTELVND